MGEAQPALPKEYHNRLKVWYLALWNAHRNLVVERHFRVNRLMSDEYCSYSSDGLSFSALVGPVAQKALIDSAIVLLCQVYSTGSDGPGFASNRDPEVQRIRSEMGERVQSRMRLTKNEFDQFLDRIRKIRNQLVAHYDGCAADYDELSEGVAKMLMPGASLRPEEIDRLEMVVAAMLSYAHAKSQINDTNQ